MGKCFNILEKTNHYECEICTTNALGILPYSYTLIQTLYQSGTLSASGEDGLAANSSASEKQHRHAFTRLQPGLSGGSTWR